MCALEVVVVVVVVIELVIVVVVALFVVSIFGLMNGETIVRKIERVVRKVSEERKVCGDEVGSGVEVRRYSEKWRNGSEEGW